MSEFFPNQSYGIPVEQHNQLPLLSTKEFDFYRVIGFEESFYGKTVSELHLGNLRLSRTDNRYSSLFPGQKLSYWADSIETARAEYYHWNTNKNIISFWAYDDGSSFIPTVYPAQNLTIIDGFQLGFNKLLHKLESGELLTPAEKDLIDMIAAYEPDCLAYQSERNPNGVNYLFFEKGFKKLSLREVSLRLGERKSRNFNSVYCAGSSDYTPYLEGYGYMFVPIAKTKYNRDYEETEEYVLRHQVWERSMNKVREAEQCQNLNN